jgi:hypothetical protein
MANRIGREYLRFPELIKRNWHEFSLSLRFGAHRTKKKLQRKVQNAM